MSMEYDISLLPLIRQSRLRLCCAVSDISSATAATQPHILIIITLFTCQTYVWSIRTDGLGGWDNPGACAKASQKSYNRVVI
jgi:hypothetical protein